MIDAELLDSTKRIVENLTVIENLKLLLTKISDRDHGQISGCQLSWTMVITYELLLYSKTSYLT